MEEKEKTMLIIDMPKSCHDCPLKHKNELNYKFCFQGGISINSHIRNNTKPSNCPLQPYENIACGEVMEILKDWYDDQKTEIPKVYKNKEQVKDFLEILDSQYLKFKKDLEKLQVIESADLSEDIQQAITTTYEIYDKLPKPVSNELSNKIRNVTNTLINVGYRFKKSQLLESKVREYFELKGLCILTVEEKLKYDNLQQEIQALLGTDRKGLTTTKGGESNE